MRSSFDSPFACKAIADATEERIRAEIESVIRERVDPMIKEIATNAARQVCENATVATQRDVASYGGWHVLIKFGEQTALDMHLNSKSAI